MNSLNIGAYDVGPTHDEQEDACLEKARELEPEIFTAPRGDIQGTRSSDYLCDHRDQLTFDPIPDEHSNCLLVEAMFRLEDEVPA